MASTIKVDKIEGSTGSTVTVPTGQTLTVTDGLAIGSIPTITVAKGGTNTTSYTAGDILYATGATTLAKLPKGAATEVIAMNSGATAPEWVTAGGGKTLVAPTQIVNDTSQVSASTSGTALPSSGTALFFYPIGALLTGSFTKTSATSVLGISFQYSLEDNGTSQHDTYMWAGTGVTLGTAGDNFKYHLGDDCTRSWVNEQWTKGTVYITGMSAASHTINIAAGTFPDRTHTYYYCPSQTHSDRSVAVTPSTIWCWETEV